MLALYRDFIIELLNVQQKVWQRRRRDQESRFIQIVIEISLGVNRAWGAIWAAVRNRLLVSV